MKRIVLLTLGLIMLALPAWGSISQVHTIEGVLTDNSGNPLSNGTYDLSLKLFTVPTGGASVYYTTDEVDQYDGVFRAEMTDVPPSLLDQDLWLEIGIYGESPMAPRIRVNPVPVALRASTVDPANAVTSVNSQKGNVNIVGGTNVTVSNTTGTITISASAGAGGDDGDWEIVGNDLYRTTGRIYVGEFKKKDAAGDGEEKSIPANSTIEIQSENEGLTVYMGETGTAPDGRGAVYGYRYSPANMNPGTGLGAATSNAGVMGFNDSSESYTFGVSAFSKSAGLNNGALLAADDQAVKWASLVYRDGIGNTWGLYSQGNVHVDGLTETHTLRLQNGASDGYIMTSDAAGNAIWSPPAAASDDGDWTISGSNMYHAVTGAVAIGTSSPHPWTESSARTTMQVSALFNPTLALDATYGGLKRWTISGGSGGVRFNSSTDYAVEGTTAMQLSETLTQFNNAAGVKRVAIVTEAEMDDGGAIDLFGSPSSNSTLHLDGLAGTGGGRISVNDVNGLPEVIITANHNNSGVGRVVTPVLEITGGSDLSEQFDIGNTSALTEPGMVVSIDPENPGRLTLSGKAYDKKVAGVISGAGGVKTGMVMGQRGTEADGELPVALVGRVYVWADASGGAIEPGDMLTTADRPGHAMKVKDHDLATGAILGKAMTGLAAGQGLILTLVTLQ